MLRTIRRLNQLFSTYQDSIVQYNTLTSVSTKTFKVNKTVVFHGVPNPSNEMVQHLNNVCQQITTNTTIVLSDCSLNLALNRKLIDKSFQQMYYSKIDEKPENMFGINPEVPESVQECYIMPKQLFFQGADDPEKQIEIDQQLFIRCAQKLEREYGVRPIMNFPTAIVLFNDPESVCIAGISELFTRRCLADSYPLDVLKQAFIRIAETMKEIRQNDQQDPLAYHNVVTEVLTQMFPEVLIGRQAQQLYYLLHKVQEDCTVIGKTYVQDRLEALLSIQTPQIRQLVRETKSLRRLLSSQRLTVDSTDQIMIQKHALLESIYKTNLWTSSHIKNPFPYLKQDYLTLQPQQQATVKSRYLYHLNRYLSASRKMSSNQTNQ